MGRWALYGEHRIQVERRRRKTLCLSTGPNTGCHIGRADLLCTVMAQYCRRDAEGNRRQYACKKWLCGRDPPQWHYCAVNPTMLTGISIARYLHAIIKIKWHFALNKIKPASCRNIMVATVWPCLVFLEMAVLLLFPWHQYEHTHKINLLKCSQGI